MAGQLASFRQYTYCYIHYGAITTKRQNNIPQLTWATENNRRLHEWTLGLVAPKRLFGQLRGTVTQVNEWTTATATGPPVANAVLSAAPLLNRGYHYR